MFFFGFGVLKFNRWTKHIPGRWMGKHKAMQCWCSCCRKTKALAHEKKEWWKKFFLAGWGLLIGGCVFLLLRSRGVAFLSSKNIIFQKKIIRNRSFWFFFSVLASWNLTDGPNTSLGGGWGNIRQCNVDVAVAEKQSTCTWEKKGGKKNCVAGWGLLIGGCVFLFVGGTALKGGSLSELPKTSFFNKILIRNRSFGRWCFFSVLASWNLTDGPNTSLGGGWGNIRQCNVDVAVAQKQKHLHMRKYWKNTN